MIKGLYFHIPFCSYKCPYCDFVSFVDSSIDHREYLLYLLEELRLYKDLSFQLKTLYFGGGTPSMIKPKLYGVFLEKLSSFVDISGVEEISIEVNPESYGLEDYKALKEIGFNRISIGAQSLREKGLKVLGRLHSVKDVFNSVDFAYKAGFDNINLDIIYGYPSQSLKDLKEELDVLKSLPLSHLSFYLLTPYEDTQFGNLYRKGLLELPEEDTIASMYNLICDSLEAIGFLHYEISNFSLPGYECKHNLLYWTYEEFLGIGVSAWSFVEDVRFGNTKNIKVYKESIKKGKRPIEYQERLEGKGKLFDYLFVALRTRKGVEKALLPKIPEYLKDFFKEEGDRWRLNRKGMLLINEVLLHLKDVYNF